ncbi:MULTISPECIES: hypothetical protein [Persicobacter]|uniref:Uncharacterized protein n=1 Tax=Persicobacter diffluens TaxID=981 RepID=A0AAN5AHP6_9BACT|nr:hypothetical protein [Persicobacter sp. CCB-QB2]GJM59515.1 hypothetical protein PEDI_00670 [Persicobacter diffluens]
MSNSKQFSFLSKAFYPLMMVFAIIILALSIGVYHHVNDGADASAAVEQEVPSQAVGQAH